MKISVIHEIICDKAEWEVVSGKLNCTGVTEQLLVDQFPNTIGFSLVAWLRGVTEKNNEFKITLVSPLGKLLGEFDGYKVKIQDSNPAQSIAVLLFHFNSLFFQSAQEYYTIQIHHQDTLLLSKVVGVAPSPRITPTTLLGDIGYVRL